MAIDFQFYGITGIALYKQKIVQIGRGTIDIPNGIKYKFGNGINLGLGILYPIDNVSIYAQFKYQSPVERRMILDFGIAFMFGY